MKKFTQEKLELGKLIKMYRERAGYQTQFQGAKHCGLSHVSLLKYERGEIVPSRLGIERIIDTFLVTQTEAQALRHLCLELRKKRK